MKSSARRPINRLIILSLISLWAYLPAQEAVLPIHPELAVALNVAAYNQHLPVYINFKERIGYKELAAATEMLGRAERRELVISSLRNHADDVQSSVRTYLDDAASSGDVRDIQHIWTINVIAFSAVPAVILDLAARFAEIDLIRLDQVLETDKARDDFGQAKRNRELGLQTPPLFAPQDGVVLINAPLVWAEGDSGQNVIVANVDTGTDWDHPDLVHNLWNNPGEDIDHDGRTVEWNGTAWVFDPDDVNGIDDDDNGYTDDFIGWSFSNNSNNPQDFDGHGTATAGLVAGDGTGGTETGVAPRANLMILRIENTFQSTWWVAYQYAMLNGARVTTSSFSWKWGSNPDYENFRAITDIELALDVVHTNSIGNQGAEALEGCDQDYPVPYNIAAPGNSPSAWMLHPDQDPLLGGSSSVIACGNVGAQSDFIEGSSGLGPAAWENIQDRCPTFPYSNSIENQDYPWNLHGPVEADSIGILKPDVSAPGNGTTSTLLGGGYTGFSGTSAATPHVGGAVALLISANPELSAQDVSRILQVTSIDKGAPGKDLRYGAGRIDVYAAYQRVLAEMDGLQVPNRPTALNVYSDFNSPTSMQISWTDPTNLESGDTLLASSFTVEIERDGALVGSVAGGIGAYQDDGLNDGQSYEYVVYTRLLDGMTNSLSIHSSWIAGGSPVPTAPTGFTCAADSPGVVISWTDPQQQIDGTPLDDLAEVQIWRDGVHVASVPPGIGTYTDQPAELQVYSYFLTSADSEDPVNLSEPTSEVQCQGGAGLIFTTSANLGIPNNDPAGVSSTLVLENPAGRFIADLDLYINILHSNFGDLQVKLSGPNGVEIIAVDRPGFPEHPIGNNGDNPNVYLDDEAATSIEDVEFEGVEQVVGIFQPFPGTMSAFDNIDYGGEWTLTVSDLFPSFPPGTLVEWGFVMIDSDVVGIDDVEDTVLPVEFALDQNYPNPFNPETVIRYSLPVFSETSLLIFDVQGRLIRGPLAGAGQPGIHEITWDGRNNQGNSVASGVYFYQLNANGQGATPRKFQETRKMIMLR